MYISIESEFNSHCVPHTTGHVTKLSEWKLSWIMSKAWWDQNKRENDGVLVGVGSVFFFNVIIHETNVSYDPNYFSRDEIFHLISKNNSK